MAFAAIPVSHAAQIGSTYTDDVPTTETVLFTGVSLDDVRSVSAMFNPGTMDTAGEKATATPWHVVRLKDDLGATTNLTVQFQACLGDYTKCVTLSLWQSGDDIMGKAVGGRYYSQRYAYVEGGDAAGAGWSSNKSYSISNISLSDEDDDFLRTELWWNGGASGVWDGTTANWLDKNGAACAWIPGARATFTNSAVATVSIAAGGVTASHLKMQGRRVTFTGGTLALVCSAEVEMRCGKVRFECPVSSSDGFRVLNAMCSAGIVNSSTATKFFDGIVIADVTGAIAVPNGNNSSEDGFTPPRSYHASPSTDGLTFGAQIQWFAGDWTKCALIEVKQSGADATVARKTGYYYNDQNIKGIDARGYDFENNPNRKANTGLYEIKMLRLVARVELAGANTISGLVRADNGATLALVDGGTINGGATESTFAIPDAILEVAHTRQRFLGKIDSHENHPGTVPSDLHRTHGGLLVKGTVDASRDGTLSYPFSLPSKTNPGPVTIFQNADLSGFVAGNANFDRQSMTPAEAPWPSTPFFFYNDGEKAWMQFHRIDNNGKEAKWVVYEFRQSGNDITCKRLKGGWHGGSYSNKPANFTQYECFGYDVYNFGDGGGDYSCSNLTVTVKNMTDTTVAISSTAANNFASGVTVDGAVLAATAACALPQSAKPVRIANTTRDVPRQTIDVVNGGKLFLTSSAGNDNLGTSTVTLKGGSQIFFCRPNANGSTSKIVAEGGSEIVVECGMPLSRNNKDVFLKAKFNNALSNIVLKDGSTVRGSGHVRVGGEGGYVESSRFRVEGTVPSRIAHDIAIQRLKINDQTPFYLDVPDVSGNAGADLFLDGSITNFYFPNNSLDAQSCREIVKREAGTVRLGSWNSYIGPLTVQGGTVLLGADGALNGSMPINLAGGAIDVDGRTTAAGALTLSANSSIAVGEGGEISFANSSALEWSGGTLNITGDGTIRFGSDSSGLTSAQLQKIRWNGNQVHIRLDGRLSYRGTIVIVL